MQYTNENSVNKKKNIRISCYLFLSSNKLQTVKKSFMNFKLTISNEKNARMSSRMLKFIYPHYLRYQISLIVEIRTVTHRPSFTAVSTVNRSIVPARFSTSAIMSSNLDITKCFEFAKELTLQAGKVSHSWCISGRIAQFWR